MKFKSPLTLAILVIFSVLLISLTNLPSAQAATQVSGLISTDTTWTKNAGPYNLAGPIGIPEGVTLTIEPGTIVNFNNYYMQINGTLSAKGTTTDNIILNVQAARAITFTSSSVVWNEASATGCIIENALINSTQSSGDSRISITNASPKINNCTVLGAEYYYSGFIRIAGGNPIISNNSLQSCGISISGENNALIINNTITGELDGTPAISTSGNSIIVGNLISTGDIGTGIEIYSGFSTIQNNTIMYNEKGIDVQFYEVGSSLSTQAQLIQFNNLFSNDYNVIMKAGSSTINLPNNWWGTTDAQAIAQTIFDSKYDFNLGTVTFTPHLTSFNSQAAAAAHPITFEITGISYAEGTILTVDSTDYTYFSFPLIFYWQEGSQHNYAFNSSVSSNSRIYNLDSVDGLSSGQSQILTITESGSITANYKLYYTIIFDQQGIESDYAGTVLTVDSVDYTKADLPLTFLWEYNSLHDYSYTSPLQVDDGTRYVVGYMSSPSPINNNLVINATYSTQYLLTIDNGGHSSVYPSEEDNRWFTKGSTVYFYVSDWTVPGTSGTQYVFAGWVGYGIGSYTGTSSTGVTMNGPIIETAQWKTQYNVTFVTSGLDTTAFGKMVEYADNYYNSIDAGANVPVISYWADSGSTLPYSFSQTIASTESGKRFALGSTTPTALQNLDGPQIVTGAYKTQYQVTVLSSPQTGATTTPAGYNTWQDPGSMAISVTPNAGYQFTSWTTIGAITVNSATSSTTTATITGPGWITANMVTSSATATHWYSGDISPSNSIGIDGDYYLNTANYYIYTKNAGTWTQLICIQGPQGETGATGPQGPAGTPGSSGSVGTAAKWLSGSGAPASSLGNNGDFYLNTATSDVYSKASGSWSIVVNIKGETGADGATGAQGSKGDTGATGPKGDTGAAGATGATGPAGPQGVPGRDGVNGSVLYVGTTAPQDTAGKTGDFYLNTATGDIYAKSSASWTLIENTVETTENLNGERGIATLTFSEGKAAVDQTTVTGVKVDINDPSATNGAIAAVSSINYGTSQPSNTANLAVNGAVFYDVKVIPQTSISQDALVTITLTNNAFNGQENAVAYWDGTSWVNIPCTYISPNLLTVSLPVSALTGTPFAVWTSVNSGSQNPILLIALAISIAVIVAAVALVFYSRKGRTAKR